MTESEWLLSSDPLKMLQHLQVWNDGPMAKIGSSAISRRKVRLFACACCRLEWQLLRDGRSRTAIETAELFVDGLTTAKKLAQASRDVQAVYYELLRLGDGKYTREIHVANMAGWASYNHDDCMRHASKMAGWASHNDDNCLRAMIRDNVSHANLLREIVGNEVCSTTLPDKYRTPLTTRLSLAAYDDRLPDGSLDPERLLVLADALEEEGCTIEQILNHLRNKSIYIASIEDCGPSCPVCGDGGNWRHGGPGFEGDKLCSKCSCVWTPGTSNRIVREVKTGPHFRGCWVLDLMLGKE